MIEMIEDQEDVQGQDLEADQEAQEEDQEVGLSLIPEIIEEVAGGNIEEIDVGVQAQNQAEDPEAEVPLPEVDLSVVGIRNQELEAPAQEAEVCQKELKERGRTENLRADLDLDQDQDQDNL